MTEREAIDEFLKLCKKYLGHPVGEYVSHTQTRNSYWIKTTIPKMEIQAFESTIIALKNRSKIDDENLRYQIQNDAIQ